MVTLHPVVTDRRNNALCEQEWPTERRHEAAGMVITAMENEGVKGYSFQWEKGNKTQSLHIQLYVVFRKSTRFNTVRRVFTIPGFEPPHVEMRRDKHEVCTWYTTNPAKRIDGEQAYFSSDGFIKKAGQQGQRNDIVAAAQAIDAGTDLADVARQHQAVYIKYGHNLLNYQRLTQLTQRAAAPVYTFFIHGPANMGKTTGAHMFLERCMGLVEGAPNGYYVWSPKNTGNWWEGYCGQEYVIIDDLYSEASFPRSDALRIFNPIGRSCRVAVHGNQVHMRGRFFFITSNRTHDRIFKNEDAQELEPITRRFKTGGIISPLDINRILSHRYEKVGYDEETQSDVMFKCAALMLPNIAIGKIGTTITDMLHLVDPVEGAHDETLCNCGNFTRRPEMVARWLCKQAVGKFEIPHPITD